MIPAKPYLTELYFNVTGSCHVSSMWYRTEPAIKEEEDFYSLTSMTHAFENVNQSPKCMESWTMKELLLISEYREGTQNVYW